jgi:hypothetical protein
MWKYRPFTAVFAASAQRLVVCVAAAAAVERPSEAKVRRFKVISLFWKIE